MAFADFHGGISLLCLAILAGALPLAHPVMAQELELRGALDGSASAGNAPSLPRDIEQLIEMLLRDPEINDAADPDSFDPIQTGAIAPAESASTGDPARAARTAAPALRLSTNSEAPGTRLNRGEGAVEDGQSRRMNQRVGSLQGPSLRRDSNPYAPEGLRVGSFTLLPTLEQGITATSNGSNSPGGEAAVISETTLRLRATSDWARHNLDLAGELTYENALSGDVEPELRGSLEADLDIDISNSLTGNARLAYDASRVSVNSPLAIAGVDQQPVRHRLTAELGLEKTVGPLLLAATGRLTRNEYGAARLTDGSSLAQDDRDSTLALGSLRVGYEISPALVPFAEIEAGRRNYDEARDRDGYERSGLRLGARAGVAVDIAEKLSGEVSAGWLSESFDDERLRRVSGLALAASINWSPRRGTNVSLDASTEVEAGSGGGSGSLLYSGRLAIEHELRSNLTGDLAFGAAWRDFEAGSHDLTLNGEASLTWWLNRYAALVSRLRHEWRSSSDPTQDYDATSIYVGVKMQR